MSRGKGNGIKKGVEGERKAKPLDFKCCLVGNIFFPLYSSFYYFFHHSTTTSLLLLCHCRRRRPSPLKRKPPPSPHHTPPFLYVVVVLPPETKTLKAQRPLPRPPLVTLTFHLNPSVSCRSGVIGCEGWCFRVIGGVFRWLGSVFGVMWRSWVGRVLDGGGCARGLDGNAVILAAEVVVSGGWLKRRWCRVVG